MNSQDIYNIKDINDIIIYYKDNIEYLEYVKEHKKKMEKTLFSISNLIVMNGIFFDKLHCTYYLDVINKNDPNRIITKTEFTCKTGMRIVLNDF